MSGGVISAHSGVALGQRPFNRQPGGGSIGVARAVGDIDLKQRVKEEDDEEVVSILSLVRKKLEDLK